MNNIEVTIKQELTPQMINDIIASGLEGGINYWCVEANILSYGNPENKNDIEFASDVIGYDGELELVTDDHEKFNLNLQNFLKGIEGYCKMNNITPQEMYENQDAETSDVIIQLAIFDEIIFG